MISSNQIKILLTEDHAIVRQGLCALLHAHGLKVVGEARTGREAVQMARILQPDVILMDFEMPELNGLQATRQILAANPAAKVLALSAHLDDSYVQRMIEAGASGFLEKQTCAEILVKAIREVAKGRPFFSPAITKRLCDRNGFLKTDSDRLTPRESEVLQLVAEGSSNKQMAAKLGISIKTLEKHRQHLMDKLDIHDTAGLTRHAIATGVIGCGVSLKVA